MKLTLRVIAILSFIIAIAWMFYSPGFEPLLAFFAGITTLILSFVGGEKETETLDQRNRRILLNHVENFWVKGVLEKSLHGAAMLELGIKEDPAAVTYPWAIKKEATDETLPADISMLEIFEHIGMGRSLLILGAPGSGKTTMLLELARQLIERARQNETEPIPMVFNLASWTEKLTISDWLAQELNNIYYVPRKTAPDWVKGNKLLLLLDGLDEVRQESRAKCVDAINQFRKEHGWTSLAVCSRSQDYEDLQTKLAFDGAIEVQPLTQKQVNEFFNRFGKEMAGLKSVLKKDSALREMAETPLFLSIMIMAYRDKNDVDILVSQNIEAQRKYLFDNYIKSMFEHSRSKNDPFNKSDVLCWMPWLAHNMAKHSNVSFLIERMQPTWLDQRRLIIYRWLVGVFISLPIGILTGVGIGHIFGATGGVVGGLIFGFGIGLTSGMINDIQSVDILTWNTNEAVARMRRRLHGGLRGWFSDWDFIDWLMLLFFMAVFPLAYGLIEGLVAGLVSFLLYSSFGTLLIDGIESGLKSKQIEIIKYPKERLSLSARNFLLTSSFFFLIFGGITALTLEPVGGLVAGLAIGLLIGGVYGGLTLIQHLALRFIVARNNLLPWKLIPFLDHCTDLIFLRRVGGGYIFVHRLLMEHFAAMYKEE